MRYKINYLNPLSYIYPIALIPIATIIAIFTEDTLQEYLKSTFDIWILGKQISHPGKVIKKLKIVREIK